MSDKFEPSILKEFPRTRYFPRLRLVTWHPKGLLDEELADRVLEFIEWEERRAIEPFNRFTDMNGFTKVRLKISHTFATARRRRRNYRGQIVKSAFSSDRIVGYGIAKMYEALMIGSRIRVRVFRTHDEAAKWLGVEPDVLDLGSVTAGALESAR